VIDYAPKGSTFDLVDDHRDRLEEMKVALGLPSRLRELGLAGGRRGSDAAAERPRRDLETEVTSAARCRADLRVAFAR